MTDYIWRLRLWLAYHLVGDKSFIANVDIIGHFVARRTKWGTTIVRDVYIYEDHKCWLRSRPR